MFTYIYIHIHEYTCIYCFLYLGVLQPISLLYIHIHTYTAVYIHIIVYMCIYMQYTFKFIYIHIHTYIDMGWEVTH